MRRIRSFAWHLTAALSVVLPVIASAQDATQPATAPAATQPAAEAAPATQPAPAATPATAPAPAAPPAPAAATPPTGSQSANPQAPKPFTADTLSLAQINAAIAKGVAALYKIEPQYTFPPEYLFTHGGFNQELRNAMGNHALACWAMIVSGESYQNPPLYRRINWVLSGDQPLTYDRGMRLQMLAELPRTRFSPWIHRDYIVYMKDALTDKGSFPATWSGGPSTGLSDNANAMYGVLGLWAAQRGGETVSTKMWEEIDKYWREAQEKTPGDKAAGWAVNSFAADNKGQVGFYTRVNGPMTAGGVATLTLTERYLMNVDPGMAAQKNSRGSNLAKGIRWLDENFAIDDKAEASDWFYYMWTIQGVGRATGYRTFNGVDWFREVTAELLTRQGADGIWAGDKGKLLSTGFALLYLARANDPVAIAKIRFSAKDKQGNLIDTGWNNRPHDMVNFVDYASDEYETNMTWEIAELTQPAYELIESPLLFLSTDKPFEFSDRELDNLRDYIAHGGLLVTNPESTDMAAASKAVKDLAAKLFPGKELKPVDKNSPLLNLHQEVKTTQLQVIDNGLRPLMIHCTRDIGSGLQGNEVGRSESFTVLSNLYLYATGMNPRRPRLENNYVTQHVKTPTIPLTIARIKHDGDFDPEPAALEQLQALLANQADINAKVEIVEPERLSSQDKVAFLTTTGNGSLSAAQGAAIKKWVADGGTLWIDAAGGGAAAVKSAHAMLEAINPGAVGTPMGRDNPILSGQGYRGGTDNKRVEYRFFALRALGPVATPRLEYIDFNNRAGIVFSAEDLTCGLAGIDHWNILGYRPDSARRLVVNGVLAAMSNAPASPIMGAP